MLALLISAFLTALRLVVDFSLIKFVFDALRLVAGSIYEGFISDKLTKAVANIKGVGGDLEDCIYQGVVVDEEEEPEHEETVPLFVSSGQYGQMQTAQKKPPEIHFWIDEDCLHHDRDADDNDWLYE
jgi:hypothetical protein